MEHQGLITLLTDFGVVDYFVPAVKGVILSINPAARVIDLTHEIPAQDIEAAAFTLGVCYYHFPARTVHLAVVDPGVGSARRPIVVAAGEQYFVGPDNGLFSYIYARQGAARVFHAARDEYFRHPVSATFHGRDVFAPLAAHLSLGLKPDAIGDEIGDYLRFDLSRPSVRASDGAVIGQIIHVDRFGNCITNFTERELDLNQAPSAPHLIFGGQKITRFVRHFAEEQSPGELFAYLGSAGYWEIGVWRGSAAERAGARQGAEIVLEF
jgi:S-adenosylmethionine hydrolase